MLVEFSVKNFLSIKDKQVFSMYPTKDKEHLDTHTSETGVSSVPKLLRSAVMYGRNAAGKTNIVRAFRLMKTMVEQSTKLNPDQPLHYYQPFFIEPFKSEPTEFEVIFIDQGIRYQYGFTFNQKRILEEWLLVFKTSQSQQWFSRAYDTETDSEQYKLGGNLAGPKAIWRQSTRSNALFLSTAVQLNSESLKVVFDWIVNKLVPVCDELRPNTNLSIQMMQSNDINKQNYIKTLVKYADLGIKDITLSKRQGFNQSFQVDFITGEFETYRQEGEIDVPEMIHKTDFGEAKLDLFQESLGTQQLFAFGGMLYDILKSGKVLVVDELTASLHPHLAIALVELFNNSTHNPHGAQLIFNTHETTLMDLDLFRRDQIWFVDKNPELATILYPLTDFSPRKTEALERGYLMGRYGAIPLLTEFELFAKDNVEKDIDDGA